MAKRKNTKVENHIVETPIVETPIVENPIEDVENPIVETPIEDVENPIEDVENPIVENPIEDVEKVKSSFISQSTLCKDLVKFIDDNKSIEIENVTDILGSIDNYINSVKSSDKGTIMSNRYNLYLTIRGMIENKDYDIFKQKINVLNKAFIIDKTGLFNPTALLTDDYLWTYGSGSRVAYQLTITGISRLSNITQRAKTLKIVDIRSILKYYNATASGNIIRYYDL